MDCQLSRELMEGLIDNSTLNNGSTLLQIFSPNNPKVSTNVGDFLRGMERYQGDSLFNRLRLPSGSDVRTVACSSLFSMLEVFDLCSGTQSKVTILLTRRTS
eukprot:Blabericola_migrator_1__6291@NODE_3174_length_1980_cov_8_181390_g1986_i0_p2_GENE_NODE_3174_length_1980_cov_8_181390_g1986_i0NODE_3174_length_1980_cov_8_181390_g1986_i0_p2_ORF_typecomplete_len102_score11_77_NODE_3174_length_1980_cov_8_181390_g1986_i09931298